jgi:hypothetical protein
LSRALAGALLLLPLASASGAQSLVGTWEGSVTCKDERGKSKSVTEGALLVSQEFSGGFERLYSEFEGTGFFGMAFPSDGGNMFGPGVDAGLGFLTVCTSAADGSYTTVWPFRFKLKDDGGTLELSGSYWSPYGHGSCKGSFRRTSTTDPMIAPCP